MSRTARILSFVSVGLCTLVACGEPDCPDGSVYVEDAKRCIRTDGGIDGDGAVPDSGPDADVRPDGGGDGCVPVTFYADEDGDEFGDPVVTVEACSAPEGYVSDGTDCDDTCNACNPTATEICDALDNDCDEDVDEAVTRSCGTTSEGLCELGTETCADGSWGDCEGAVEPVDEVCDGADDENCDGSVDEGCSCSTGDSRSCGTDEGECSAGTQACSSGSWAGCEGSTGPSAETCDGLDNDCDGSTDDGVTVVCYPDADSDSYASSGATPSDRCSCGTGWTARAPTSGQSDCDDLDDERHDGAAEVCDGKDNDCDGSTDEGVTITCYLDEDDDGYGLMSDAVEACACPSGRVSRSDAFDCHDGNEDAHPGQLSYFQGVVPPTCSGVCFPDWGDFNCDGTEEPRWTNTSDFCTWNTITMRCGGSGWVSDVPSSCGSGKDFRSCATNAAGDGCESTVEFRFQQCR